MNQKLLVEGINDLHFVSNLAEAMQLPKVKGYEDSKKYKAEFGIVAEGKDNIRKELRKALKTTLATEGLTNLGIILDTDKKTIAQNWDSISSILAEKYKNYLPKSHNTEGVVIETPDLKIGVWMMPNNENEGYLEHFFEEMLNKNDDLWQKATRMTQEFINQEINRFTPIHKQKADVHTWLAWQKETETRMGFGLKQNKEYFNFDSPTAIKFKNWWHKTFELEGLK